MKPSSVLLGQKSDRIGQNQVQEGSELTGEFVYTVTVRTNFLKDQCYIIILYYILCYIIIILYLIHCLNSLLPRPTDDALLNSYMYVNKLIWSERAVDCTDLVCSAEQFRGMLCQTNTQTSPKQKIPKLGPSIKSTCMYSTHIYPAGCLQR